MGLLSLDERDGAVQRASSFSPPKTFARLVSFTFVYILLWFLAALTLR